MIALLLTLAVYGFVVWLILQIPMPAPLPTVIIALATLVMILFVLQALGFHTGLALPSLR